MTIKKLHKILTAMINEGQGNRLVCVDKSKVHHPLEADGVVFIPATSATIQTHEMADDDGGFKVLANGRVAQRTALIITAEC